jgi:hypothetical protein
MSIVSVGMNRSDFLAFERQLVAANARFKNAAKRVTSAIDKSVREVTKATARQMAKSISEKIMISQKVLLGTRASKSKHIETRHRTLIGNATGEIVLSKTSRLQLIYFGAKQNSKGVTYKIERKGQRRFIKSAFITTANNQRFVTKRLSKKRLPITGPLRGPSPWGVFVLSGMIQPTADFARTRLRSALSRQLRAARLRAEGVIPV